MYWNDRGYQKVKNAVKLLKKYKRDFHVKCEATVTAANIRDYIENGKKIIFTIAFLMI